MADSASETITIDAPIDRVWSIATDIEGYPGWAHDVKEVVVRDRDDEGRPVEVEFRASALGRSTHYTLRYDYSSAPGRLEWSMVDGDIQRSIDGAYTLESVDDARTKVTYDLAIELVVSGLRGRWPWRIRADERREALEVLEAAEGGRHV